MLYEITTTISHLKSPSFRVNGQLPYENFKKALQFHATKTHREINSDIDGCFYVMMAAVYLAIRQRIPEIFMSTQSTIVTPEFTISYKKRGRIIKLF